MKQPLQIQGSNRRTHLQKELFQPKERLLLVKFLSVHNQFALHDYMCIASNLQNFQSRTQHISKPFFLPFLYLYNGYECDRRGGVFAVTESTRELGITFSNYSIFEASPCFYKVYSFQNFFSFTLYRKVAI